MLDASICGGDLCQHAPRIETVLKQATYIATECMERKEFRRSEKGMKDAEDAVR